MTDGWIRAIVEAIHSTRTQTVIYIAGGASQALGWLMSVPGASNTILEVLVPYAKSSMVQLLGKVPAQFTSQETVEEMALLAYNRALKLSRPGLPVLGVSFTGSLASTCPKRGSHRFYLATRTYDRLYTSHITLLKICNTSTRVCGLEKKKTKFLATSYSRQLQMLVKFPVRLLQSYMCQKFPLNVNNSMMRIKSCNKSLMEKYA